MSYERQYILIDDDKMVNNLHTILFKLNGITENILIFVSAQDAFDYIMKTAQENRQIDFVIFLDIYMPGMNGWEFLDLMTKQNGTISKKARIVMVTSSVSEDERHRAFSYPLVSEFITKPLKREHISELISRFGNN